MYTCFSILSIILPNLLFVHVFAVFNKGLSSIFVYMLSIIFINSQIIHHELPQFSVFVILCWLFCHYRHAFKVLGLKLTKSRHLLLSYVSFLSLHYLQDLGSFMSRRFVSTTYYQCSARFCCLYINYTNLVIG